MDFRQKYKAFKKRFGVADKQLDPAKEFQVFKQRILNICEYIDIHVEDESVVRFCTWLGREVVRYKGVAKHFYNIRDALSEETNEAQFYFLIELIFALPIKTESYGQSVRYSRNILYQKVAEAFHISDINANLTIVDDEVLVYPRGEGVLDEGLVEEVFEFLNADSQKHFVAALKFYKQGTDESHVKSAESIRRCLEEFLRFKLKNAKGLDGNVKELLARFKELKTSTQIKTIAHQVLTYLDDYFNEHSKHKDGKIGEAENEFILYQSGLLMRYINKVL